MSMSKCLPADMPVGFRFEPKVEEIIFHYLGLKMIGKDSEVDHVIRELNFYDFDPRDLPAKSRIKSDDQIWWFFCRQEIGKTNKRTTKSGRWEITGETKDLMARDNKTCIGKKKILVFYKGKSRGKSRGPKPIWVVHEYHPLVRDPQRPYIICRLEKRTEEKAGTPGCYVGEPSGSDTASEIENPVTPAAVSGVHSLAEVNSEKDNGMIFSNSFNDGKNIMQVQCGADEPEESSAEFVDGLIVDPHENNCGETTKNLSSNSIQLKSLKRSYFLDGPASVDTTEILPATENPVAPAAISEFQAHVHTEVNADLFSQPFLPGGCYTEDDIFYYSDFFDDDQKINGVMDESHPELQNYLPHLGPHVISSFENKTDEMGGTPDCFIGKPSGNIPFDIEDQVAPPAIQEVHGLAEVNSEKENSMIFSNSFNDGHNMMQVQCEAEEPEESSAEFLDGLIVDPHENDRGETTKNRFNNSIQPKSLKRLYFPDGPANVDTNIEGVDGRVKRFRSFALGEQPR